ncbi:polypeptide N-acetylgalactosaminyltransferase 5-like [Physella acuta]|uniref:polypeptide N-acetylgalactosaminyltransferase 5-like n=1 Tax=Physella acuta TaxID=109671 RepID=UPI0027DE0367|nr:polypeptide N-acetylgalactosaminyltransferase 5-like [Physella acuta]
MRRPVVTRLLKLFFYLLPSTLLVYTSTTLLFADRGVYSKIDGAMPIVMTGMSNLHTSNGSGLPLLNSADEKTDNNILKWITKSGLGFLHSGDHSGELYPEFNNSTDPQGLGEGGVAVNLNESLLTSEELVQKKQGWILHNFNEYLSKKMSVFRSLPYCSTQACKDLISNYTGKLDEISVIIIFHNEAWSSLLRSVHSILSRTPARLLREVILVDDNSTFDYLKGPLHRYFSPYPKVKIIHSPGRVGLIQARILGFDLSTAPVVVFLDAHIECFPGWAESLLIRIAQNPKAVPYPIIETINDKTFSVECNNGPAHYGGFNFRNLMYEWTEIPQREKDRRVLGTEPFRSPVMPGGLFAISRNYFLELGKYDAEMDFWGGENIELSFKAWMCGGSLEMDICSHVGHIFRSHTPIKGDHSAVVRNSVRAAEVWMDDYKNYFYENINYQTGNFGNVTDRKRLREGLKCHNFEWYLRNVFPELPVPHSIKNLGSIKNVAYSKCLYKNSDKLVLSECPKHSVFYQWLLTNQGQLTWDATSLCADNGALYFTKTCNSTSVGWLYRQDKTLLHQPTGRCLSAGVTDAVVSLSPCTNSPQQKWDFAERRKDLKFPV